MPIPRVFKIQDTEGTAKQLYAELTADLANPPTFVAFVRRLNRKEINKAELCRPNYTYSSAARLAKIEGGRKGGKASKRRKKKATTSEIIIYSEPLKLVFGLPYFRPGSLDAWPRLKQAFEK